MYYSVLSNQIFMDTSRYLPDGRRVGYKWILACHQAGWIRIDIK